MDIIQQFRKFYKDCNAEDFIPFIRGLNETDRRKVFEEAKKPSIARAKRERQFAPYKPVDELYNGYVYNGQDDILSYCNFFCCKKEDIDFIEFVWRDLPDFEDMENLLEEEIPEGFPKLYGLVLSNRFNRVTYHDIIPWMRKGYVDKETVKPFLAVRFADIFPRDTQTDNPVEFINEQLTEYPEILNEQIWYLFDYPHEISYSDKLNKMKVDGKTGPWTYIFNTCTADGRLDRARMLKECLNALHRNFKRDQLHWYIDLFESMKPTNEELLTLQDELIISLSSTLSKQVNMSLGMIKKIIGEKSFLTEDFLQLVPMLLASDVKATVTSTLSVLEQLAKYDNTLQEKITVLTATAFLNKDEQVQKRAAKLIAKYGNPSSEELKETLQTYFDNILMAVKPLLDAYISITKQPDVEKTSSLDTEKSNKAELPIHIREDNRIEYIADIEDLIFRLGASIKNFKPVDFYLIPEALLRLQKDMTPEVLAKLAPAVQLAFKHVNAWRDEREHFLDMICHFFFDYYKILLERIPADNKSLNKTREKSLEAIYWGNHRRSEREKNFPERAYKGFQPLMNEYINKLNDDDGLPPLCTPTNNPTWLDPKVFISRLKQYQVAGKEPGMMDMQQALQLCSLQSPENILPIIDKELNGEYRELLLWFFDTSAPLPDNRPHPQWWLTAAITQTAREIPQELLKGFETIPEQQLKGDFTVEPFINEYIYCTELNPQTKQQEEVWRKEPSIKIEIKKRYGTDIEKTLLLAGYSYDIIDFNSNVCSLMLSMPNNWKTYIAFLLKGHSYYADSTDRHLIPVFDVYREVQNKLNSLDYMFYALCMISSDKTLRAYTGDIWAELVTLNTIDSFELGKAIGAYEKIEYAPLRRATEVFEKTMLNVSPAHNKELENLISGILSVLPEEPIKGMKKLMEIYKEVQSLNKL